MTQWQEPMCTGYGRTSTEQGIIAGSSPKGKENDKRALQVLTTVPICVRNMELVLAEPAHMKPNTSDS